MSSVQLQLSQNVGKYNTLGLPLLKILLKFHPVSDAIMRLHLRIKSQKTAENNRHTASPIYDVTLKQLQSQKFDGHFWLKSLILLNFIKQNA